jgi:hypothetical protein
LFGAVAIWEQWKKSNFSLEFVFGQFEMPPFFAFAGKLDSRKAKMMRSNFSPKRSLAKLKKPCGYWVIRVFGPTRTTVVLLPHF